MEDGFVYDPFDIHGSAVAEGGRVDIARRARSLVAWLRNFGINEITHGDISAECEEEWGEDYAIVCDAYGPWGEGTESDYFDHDRCMEDFKNAVREFFACDPSVVVTFQQRPLRLQRDRVHCEPDRRPVVMHKINRSA